MIFLTDDRRSLMLPVIINILIITPMTASAEYVPFFARIRVRRVTAEINTSSTPSKAKTLVMGEVVFFFMIWKFISIQSLAQRVKSIIIKYLSVYQTGVGYINLSRELYPKHIAEKTTARDIMKLTSASVLKSTLSLFSSVLLTAQRKQTVARIPERLSKRLFMPSEYMLILLEERPTYSLSRNKTALHQKANIPAVKTYFLSFI
jgi:hypothetical protein